MSRVGQYKGINWSHQPRETVSMAGGKSPAYFIKDCHGEFTGDDFATLGEMCDYLDSVTAEANRLTAMRALTVECGTSREVNKLDATIATWLDSISHIIPATHKVWDSYSPPVDA